MLNGIVVVRRLLYCLLIIICVACAPTSAAPEETALPTLAPTPTRAINLDDPLRTAIGFLDAWQRQDFDTMYSLLTFSSQEIITPSVFRERYIDIQNTMTFNTLSFESRTIGRLGDRVAEYVYDVTFNTDILGTFIDTNRMMTVLLDPRTDDWRVAWSAGDIFAELENGARLEFVPQTPSRANIYDRNGMTLADMNRTIVTVNVVQRRVDNFEACASSLADAFNYDVERVETIFANSQPDWLTEVGKIDGNVYLENRTQLENNCSATFGSLPIRQYLPTGTRAPHIIGHVGYPNPDQVDDLVRSGFNAETMIGQAGIERTWDEVLRGTPGGRLSIIGADGTRLRTLAEASPIFAESIWLTIDAELQNYVITALAEAYNQNTATWGQTSDGASSIIMDVHTGEILAMVSYPFYDANAFTPFPAIGREVADIEQERVAEDDRNPLLNRPALGAYPSGSVFKVVDGVAILDTGAFEIEKRYYCAGFWEYEGDRRFDWLAGGHGSVNTRSAVAQSCNPFFYETGFVLNQIDPNLLPEYAMRMGLGAPTGIGDIAEATGFIQTPELVRTLYGRQWTYSDAVNLSIGQGEVEITPLQLVRMYAGIANGGDLLRPHLVREQGILTERTRVAETDVMSNFGVSPEALDTVRLGMCDVTTERYGTAWHIFNLPVESPVMEYGVCAKTGTAQATGNVPPHSWFAAYAPADAPEIAIVTMVENAGDGSAVAAPITKRILEYYFFLREDETN